MRGVLGNELTGAIELSQQVAAGRETDGRHLGWRGQAFHTEIVSRGVALEKLRVPTEAQESAIVSRQDHIRIGDNRLGERYPC